MILENLIKGKFIKRYKRFFVDCELENGEIVVAHCANTGSMKSLLDKGNDVWLQINSNPNAKLKYKLQLMRAKTEAIVCVNTHLPNKIVFDAISNKDIPELTSFVEIKPEVKYGDENSKIDIWLKEKGEFGVKSKETYIEVKNVTLCEDDLPNVAQFPDSVTDRGAKHLRELVKEVEKGNRAVMFYLINRTDGDSFKVAEHIDPKYKEAFDEAVSKGVEVLIYKTKFEFDENNNCEIKIDKKIESED